MKKEDMYPIGYSYPIMSCRFHMTITSAVATQHGRQDNSYLNLEDKIVGQVEEMLWVPSKKSVILVLRKYVKQDLPSSSGGEVNIAFPLNQYPVKPTNTLATYLLNAQSYVTKVVRSGLKFKSQAPEEPAYPFFSIRPNPWFRW
jgi:hypothetical protein